MKYLIFVLVLLFIIPVTAYATHQSTQCNLSITSEIIPITYITENRNNPDMSFYPGDGFHYLFKFNAIPECLSFSVDSVLSEGVFDVISHKSSVWPSFSDNDHSHKDYEVVPKYLTTYHFSKVLDVTQKCTVHRGGLRTCETASYTLSDPVFSYREDKELSKSESEKISSLNRDSNYKRTETQAWRFTNMQGEHTHTRNLHENESDESIKLFDDYVKSKCNDGIGKYGGCVYGHIELESKVINEKCLIAELNKMNITHDVTNDVCVPVNHNLSLKITGSKTSCYINDKGYDVCKTVKVTSSSSVNPPILSPEFEIILSKPPVKDRDNYDGKNKDDTYYPHDPIGIIHNPTLKWKDQRAETIQFVTTKTHDLKKEYEFDCNNNQCNHTISLDTVYPAIIELGNGEGITIYNSTVFDFGISEYQYFTTMTNMGDIMHTAKSTIQTNTVDYNPLFSSYPYPLLSDNKEFAFDDRQGLALYYFGSIDDDDIIHEKRRSKINFVYNVGVGLDPYTPHFLKQNFTLNEGITITKDTLQSHNETAVFSQSGYGKLYFEYPLGDIVIPDYIPKFENVTSFTTLFSVDFASKDTILDHYSMRYPELQFTKNVIIKSVNQNGTIIINDSIEFEIKPYEKIGTEYIRSYIYDKIKFDTDDDTFSEIIANDTYSMVQKYSGTGMLNVTISKTPVFFEEFTKQNSNINGTFSNKLTDLEKLTDTPETIRLTSPYDIGLSTVSPTTLIITVNGIPHTLHERYFSFGGKQTMIINVQTDNVLDANRSLGKIIINPPRNFGLIESIQVDNNIIKQPCQRGCILLFQPEKELTVSVYNKWGGVASVELEKIVRPITPTSTQPDYMVILAISMILVLIWVCYKKVRV